MRGIDTENIFRGGERTGELDFRAADAARGRRGRQFRRTGDLLRVPISREKLRGIADRITLSDKPTLTGRINLNTATKEVLAAIPRMNEQLANEIITYRQGTPFRSVGDLLAVPSVTEEIYREIADRFTVRSNAFRFISQGYVKSTNTRRRIEVVMVLVTEEPAQSSTDRRHEGASVPTSRDRSGPDTRTRDAQTHSGAPTTAIENTVSTPAIRKAHIVYLRQL